ncbi:acyltransferase 3 [Calycina marina]|uniref:Acyltransferase 3 n=1 Tax=Calycina marina TaxID=1763456 RepID=A0A9P8CHH0_9HELO|nr:acyltransferase 3 [Calycina marina]
MSLSLSSPGFKARSSIDEKRTGQIDLEANSPHAITSSSTTATPIHKLLSYPAGPSPKLRSTAWLDGVRGAAALEVYIFHAMGCWTNVIYAYGADENQTSFLALPLIRTFFVSGGAAVAMFFAISGYVLTYSSLSKIRAGEVQKVYPSVWSSMFRRGFRLYLPPILLTFCEMISTRFGKMPPLNFEFVPEATAWEQFIDWIKETNSLANPVLNFYRAIHGFVTHPKYDSVVWTIPIEFYGSFLCYAMVIMFARIKHHNLRMALTAVIAVFCMIRGSWNFFCFAGGMLMADFHLGQAADGERMLNRRASLFWSVIFGLSFYTAGLPTMVYSDAKLKPMPGFALLRSTTPMSLNMEDHSRFWWSFSGLAMLFSISQLPKLKHVFETKFCQYLGKISFSLYLVHEFSNILFGLPMKDILIRIAGLANEERTSLLYWLTCLVWFVLFTFPVFAIAAQVERWVDVPSVKFAKWLEGKCLSVYESMS